jgi:dolichol-phosphate mannosyltransferase
VKVVVVVPTYNEATNLPVLLEALLALPAPRLHVLIVDDESPDGTGRLADESAARAPDRLEVLHRHGPKGLGLAYVDGFRQALERGADVIVQMDADLSHAPGDIPRLVKELENADVVIGSRYVPGGSIDANWGFGRRALSSSANMAARTILSLRTHDATAGFRAWRRRSLEAVDPGRIRSNGYLFQVEMIYICERLGLRISEAPIHFSERQLGRSKMGLKAKLQAAVGLPRVWRLHHRLRPQGPGLLRR